MEGMNFFISNLQNSEGESKAKQIRPNRALFARKTQQFTRFGPLSGHF
jgi:hypothetical protein